MPSLVSVIIPCYAQARFLGEAVGSALTQDHGAKEVIVVNDGSPDNVREVAEGFGDRIVYLEQENKGVSGARNTGIRAARGEYVAFLDSDDVYLPHALPDLASFLDAHPDTGLVCGEALLFSDTGPEGRKSSVSGVPKKSSNFRWETVDYCPTTSTVMVRRTCFDKAGFFEEELKDGGEDWLMWVRLSLHFDMAYLDRPLARYRIHGRNASSDTDRIHRGNRKAAAFAVAAPDFGSYPARFRARLLYYRFATAWRTESRRSSLAYLIRAFLADPFQAPYGVRVVVRGAARVLFGKTRRSQCILQ